MQEVWEVGIEMVKIVLDIFIYRNYFNALGRKKLYEFCKTPWTKS
jgi:hypothetical protein